MWSKLLALAALAILAAAPAAAETIRITIDKLTFQPAQVSAHVGDTIEWVSSDFVAHTATGAQQGMGRAHPAERERARHAQHAGRDRLLLPLPSQHGRARLGGAVTCGASRRNVTSARAERDHRRRVCGAARDLPLVSQCGRPIGAYGVERDLAVRARNRAVAPVGAILADFTNLQCRCPGLALRPDRSRFAAVACRPARSSRTGWPRRPRDSDQSLRALWTLRSLSTRGTLRPCRALRALRSYRPGGASGTLWPRGTLRSGRTLQPLCSLHPCGPCGPAGPLSPCAPIAPAAAQTATAAVRSSSPAFRVTVQVGG